ncbi:MAG: inorganic pyrophosphatase, partial [Gammaproteobacteria bacterium]|nr:inorganic pyrophosphatase [Gammaproteobacteria bacterium]
LDICVLSERPIERVEVVLQAKVVGGLSMLDDGEADDKIIAVLDNDTIWADVTEVSELPSALVDRLRHYFDTYKLTPGLTQRVELGEIYGRARAERVISAALEDYQEAFGEAD